MPSVDEFVEKWRLAAVRAAELDGEATKLEEMKKVLFSELVNQSDAGSVAKAEHEARDNPRYREHIHEMTRQRTTANIAKAEAEAMRLRWESWRTKSATRRAEAQIR